jgi:hypothetical protein
VAAGGCAASQRFWVWWNLPAFALGLGVEGVAVLLGDAEGGEEVLECAAAAAEAGGVNAPVVRERRRGQPVGVAGLQERVDDDFAGDRGPGAAAQQVTGVVVEPVDDLRVGAAAQGPVGEVGLPALVGLGGLEAPAGGAGPFAGLGGNQAGGVQDPADRRGGRDVQSGLLQVPGDGNRASVPAGRGQLEPGPDDELADLVLGRLRAAQRLAGPGLDRVKSALPVAGDQAVQVLAGVPVLRGRVGDRQFFADDLQDRHACSRHDTRLSPMSRLTCRVSTVTYVVTPDTTPSAQALVRAGAVSRVGWCGSRSCRWFRVACAWRSGTGSACRTTQW